MRRFLPALALLALLTGCGAKHVAIHVTPATSVEDQPIHIVVDGLKPHQVVTLHLRSTDLKGHAFGDEAAFAADAHGVVDLDRASARPASAYSGVWPMGLIASMSAPDAPPFTLYWWGRSQRFALTVAVAAHTLASSSFTRTWPKVRFTRHAETVQRDGFYGFYYAPTGSFRRPGVLLFGGSEGGDSLTFLAELLAGHGIPALAIGYFHAPGLPDKLKNIPLEYFRGALEWLDRQPQVDPSHVSVYGVSRGSEAALLLGVHFPNLVRGVVALVPNDAAGCGIVGGRRTGGGCIGPAWTLNGKPVPYTRQFDSPYPSDNPNAIIPVETIKAPILLACGGVDQIWSSCPYSKAIVARLKAHGKGNQVRLFRYPTAGHFVGAGWAYEPGAIALDFFVPDDERGREQLWPHILTFLKGAGA